MKLGLQIPNFSWDDGPAAMAKNLGDIARCADDAGFASIWAMDHFFQIEFVGPVDTDMLEGYSLLTFLAAHTKKARLGTMVTGITYRYPGILVKTATTLDVLSGGRAWFGIGAAWNEREHMGLGVPFPPVAERFERLEETIQIALQMWSDNNGPYQGKHYQLKETLCVPAPLSRPHPPILIGGMGEQKTLRMVAQYAQGCNLFAFAGAAAITQKLKVLKQHCERLGRPYDDIEKTVLAVEQFSVRGGQGQSPAQFLEKLHQAAALGIDHYLFSMPNVNDLAVFDVLAKIMPEAEKIQVAGRSPAYR